MNAKANFTHDMLGRIIQFVLDNTITPPVPRLVAAYDEVVSINAALAAAAEAQVTGSGTAEGGVDLRVSTSRNLRDYLKYVGRTARALEGDHPGITPIFRLPASASYPALITKANSIVAAVTPIQADFVAGGLPATFLTELQDLLTAFEQATGRKSSGGITQVGGTAGIKELARRGVIAATKLDAFVRNRFRGNPEKLAAWAFARRIEKAPVRTTNTPLPAVPAPASVNPSPSSN